MDDNQNAVTKTTPTEREAQLPRAALERVLARAAELQTQGADTPEVISEARLLEIGREVGIDPDHLRLAIADVARRARSHRAGTRRCTHGGAARGSRIA